MFNVAINTVSAASQLEALFEKGQSRIDAGYNETIKPFVADCLDSCGFPPLQEAIDFLRSDDGKQLVSNIITGVKVFFLIVAFLSIAVVMGLTYLFANLWELYQAREEIAVKVSTTTVRTKREARAFIYLTKREVRRLQREAAKRLVGVLDAASGVTVPTIQ